MAKMFSPKPIREIVFSALKLVLLTIKEGHERCKVKLEIFFDEDPCQMLEALTESMNVT